MENPIINKLGEPFRLALGGTGVTGSNVDVITDPVNAGELWAVEGVTIEDETNNVTRVELLAGRIGIERPINQSGAVNASIPYRFTDGFYLADGERLIVRFIGTTTADVLRVTIDGEVRYHHTPVAKVEVSG